MRIHIPYSITSKHYYAILLKNPNIIFNFVSVGGGINYKLYLLSGFSRTFLK